MELHITYGFHSSRPSFISALLLEICKNISFYGKREGQDSLPALAGLFTLEIHQSLLQAKGPRFALGPNIDQILM